MLRYLDACIAKPKPVDAEQLLKVRVLVGLAFCDLLAMSVIIAAQHLLDVKGFVLGHYCFLALGVVCLLMVRFTRLVDLTAKLLLSGILVYFTFSSFLSGGLTSFLIPGLLVYPLATAILVGWRYAIYWSIAGLLALLGLGVLHPESQVPMSEQASNVLHAIGMLLGAGAIAVLAIIYEMSKHIGFKRLEHQRSDAEGLINRISQLLFSVNQSIKVISTEVSAIARRSEETATEMRSQSEFANDVKAGMSDLRERIDTNARESCKLASDAEESGCLASACAEAMSSTTTTMASVSEQMARTQAQMEELNRRSSEISDIVGVIQAVAEQTNLLALNAAIEAARAGEQGRGFAVVADQVRELAERTHQSSGEISQKVAGILQVTESAMVSIKQVGSLVSSGYDSSVKSNDAVIELMNTSSDISSYLSGLSASSQEQNALNESMTERFESIRSAIERSFESTADVADTIQRLENEISTLSELAGSFAADGEVQLF